MMHFVLNILIIHAQFIDMILVSFIEVIDLKSLSWFLRLSPSCARGGRPTLATALVFLKFAVSYPTKEPSSRVFAFSIRIPRCRVDQEQTSQCDLLSWRQKRAWNEEGYCNDHRKFCIDYGYISSTD